MRLAAALTVASLGLLACGSNDAGSGTDTAEPAASAGGDSAEAARVGLAYDVGGRGDRSLTIA